MFFDSYRFFYRFFGGGAEPFLSKPRPYESISSNQMRSPIWMLTMIFRVPMNLDGDDNTVTFDGDGYAGQYFKLEQTGGSRTFNISQQSTLDNDWLRIISNGSNGTVCVNQDDQGTSTSC